MAYIGAMKRIAAYGLALALAVSPAVAQEGREEMRKGVQLLSEGLQLLLRGLADEIGPILLEIQGRIIDLSLYEPPEILPNGDIIIRRKVPPGEEPPAPQDPPAEPEPGEEIEL